MVTEKSKEIAILKSLGASDGAILRIFMTEGVMIGAHRHRASASRTGFAAINGPDRGSACGSIRTSITSIACPSSADLTDFVVVALCRARHHHPGHHLPRRRRQSACDRSTASATNETSNGRSRSSSSKVCTRRFQHMGRELEVLRGIDLNIDAGEILAIVGRVRRRQEHAAALHRHARPADHGPHSPGRRRAHHLIELARSPRSATGASASCSSFITCCPSSTRSRT